MEVKICGITRLQDALWALECGVDALGFVFYRPSPRYLPPRKALGIIQRLPEPVTLVGVFVDQDPGEVRAIASDLGLHLAQLHGREDPRYCEELQDIKLLKAFRLQGAENLELLERYKNIWAVLLDGFDPARHTGTGQMANWEAGPLIREKHALVLAGGLREENLGLAVRRALPDALDVSSGVEGSPGRKDPRKLQRFVELAKSLPSPRPVRKVFSASELRDQAYGSERGAMK